jgi:N-glycosylase/DNA lyase
MAMRISMDVSLDPTLGCGQAHRWLRTGDGWQGVIGREVVTLNQTGDGFTCSGSGDRRRILDYFRADDDLPAILGELSARDGHVAALAAACPGLRLLRQDRWECLATYVLATNANVRRIGAMVESVCRLFGEDLGGRHAFPAPGDILDGRDELPLCRLGYREGRLLRLAERTEAGGIDLDRIAEEDYAGCIRELTGIEGVGPKVADCVALFAFDHLEAFPVDVRIARAMESCYGVTGSYRKVAEAGRARFGRYAGYAQELLYHSGSIVTCRDGS